MKANRRYQPWKVIGAILIGSFVLRSCTEEPAMVGGYGAGGMMPGGYANDHSSWQSGASAQYSGGGDNSYIHRSVSGITVAGDGGGNYYVGDSGSGGSVANDGN